MSERFNNTLNNYSKALASLSKAIADPIEEDRDLGGIIKAFEIVYELGWKLLKKRLEEDGLQTTGPKDVFRKAFSANYLDDEQVWLDIIADRNLTVHTYNQPLAKKMAKSIKETYAPVFLKLQSRLSSD